MTSEESEELFANKCKPAYTIWFEHANLEFLEITSALDDFAPHDLPFSTNVCPLCSVGIVDGHIASLTDLPETGVYVLSRHAKQQ